MTRFPEGSQSEGLWELALPLPPLPCPRRLYTPRFSLVADQWRRRGNLGEINLRSVVAVDVVGGGFDSQGEEIASSCQHGMSSYAPRMALGKPTENRRSNSPQRCYRGQPRRYLHHHGRPQDPRISPGQLLAKRARSPRRPNLRPTPKERSSRIAQRKGILVCMNEPAAQ